MKQRIGVVEGGQRWKKGFRRKERASKREIKKSAFADGTKVRDPYSGKKLERKRLDAKAKYGDNWQQHMAEADHITPLEKIHGTNKNKPWVTNEDLKNIANDKNNMQVVSREFNNAKRSRTNEGFVRDKKYLKDKNVGLSEKAKEDAVRKGRESEDAISKAVKNKSFHNMIDTGFEAGKNAGQYAAIMTATISGIMNLKALIQGEISTQESIIQLGERGVSFAAAGIMILFALGGSPVAAVAAPALFVTGISASMKADENIEKAKSEEAKAECAVERMKNSEVLCRGISQRVEMFHDLLIKLDRIFEKCTRQLDELVRQKTVPFQQKINKTKLTEKDIELIAVTRSLAGAVKSIIEMPILSQSGTLFEESKVQHDKINNLIPEFERRANRVI